MAPGCPAHGEAHIDHLGPDGSKIRKDPLNIRWPYNFALDLAIHELSRNYPAHIARFQQMQEESR